MAALAITKARGVRLGSHVRDVLAARYKVEAVERARKIEPLLRAIMRAGVVSAQGMARELNARPVPTHLGGKWTAQSVLNTIARLPSLTLAYKARACDRRRHVAAPERRGMIKNLLI